MDAEIAFLMANQALATPGKQVYDPFVGTGSILVVAAHFGAMTMGADIDIRVVRDGRGPDRNVWSNFKQYGLEMPVGLLRADNNLPPWHPGLKEILESMTNPLPSSFCFLRPKVFTLRLIEARARVGLVSRDREEIAEIEKMYDLMKINRAASLAVDSIV